MMSLTAPSRLSVLLIRALIVDSKMLMSEFACAVALLTMAS